MSSMQITLSDAKVRMTVQGQGTPILFLHGNPDTAEVWDELIEELRPAFCCMAPDLPGFGRSVAAPDFDFSLDGMASFIDRLLAEAGVAVPVTLVVHDIGGPYGLAWAARHPEKVSRIVIMNTVFFPDYRWHRWARVWRTPVLGELALMLMNRWLFRRELRRGSRKLSYQQIDRAYAHVTPRMKAAVLRLYRALDPAVFLPWQEALLALTAKVPSLVLWGDQDPYIDRRFAGRFGAGQVAHFSGCGHWIQLEEPRKAAARIRSFLRHSAKFAPTAGSRTL